VSVSEEIYVEKKLRKAKQKCTEDREKEDVRNGITRKQTKEKNRHFSLWRNIRTWYGVYAVYHPGFSST
jgi:2-phosphoglycerate kinase